METKEHRSSRQTSPLLWMIAFICWTVFSCTCFIWLSSTIQWLFVTPITFVAYLGMISLLKRASPLFIPRTLLSAREIEELIWWHTLYLCFIFGLIVFSSLVFTLTNQSTQYLAGVVALLFPGLFLWALIYMQPEETRDTAGLQWAVNLGWLTATCIGITFVAGTGFILMLLSGGSLDGN